LAARALTAPGGPGGGRCPELDGGWRQVETVVASRRDVDLDVAVDFAGADALAPDEETVALGESLEEVIELGGDGMDSVGGQDFVGVELGALGESGEAG
jgi:hypothetical protein